MRLCLTTDPVGDAGGLASAASGIEGARSKRLLFSPLIEINAVLGVASLTSRASNCVHQVKRRLRLQW